MFRGRHNCLVENEVGSILDFGNEQQTRLLHHQCDYSCIDDVVNSLRS